MWLCILSAAKIVDGLAEFTIKLWQQKCASTIRVALNHFPNFRIKLMGHFSDVRHFYFLYVCWVRVHSVAPPDRTKLGCDLFLPLGRHRCENTNRLTHHRPPHHPNKTKCARRLMLRAGWKAGPSAKFIKPLFSCVQDLCQKSKHCLYCLFSINKQTLENWCLSCCWIFK